MSALSKSTARFAFCILLIIGVAIVEGREGPTEREAHAAIVDHYEDRGYEVRVLEFGDITRTAAHPGIPAGVEEFTVRIESITLAELGSRGVGEEMIFTKAAVRLRKQSDSGGAWIVCGISNIRLP
jgi:hypothetical protein